jgi:hypothetical protein
MIATIINPPTMVDRMLLTQNNFPSKGIFNFETIYIFIILLTKFAMVPAKINRAMIESCVWQ